MQRRQSPLGQAIVESILILPIFFLFVFGLIQIGQIGVAMVTASYAAGSIARHDVQLGDKDKNVSDRLSALLFGGMTQSGVQQTQRTAGGLLQNMTVNACIRVNPLPFVGPFMNQALHDKYSGGGTADSCTDNADSKALFYFVPSGGGGKYYFVVRGTASAVMNYQN